MKNKLLRFILLVVVLGAFVAMAAGSGSSNTPASQGQTSEGASSSTAKEQTTAPSKNEKVEYSIGETSVHVWKTSIGTNRIKVAIPVTNIGDVNLYLSSSSVDIENSDGSLAMTMKTVSVFPQIIQPGETAYYYDETTYDGTNTEGLKVVPHVKAEKAKVDCIRLDVSDLQIKESSLGPRVMGRVHNTTESKQSMVYVIANLFDKDGKLISQQFTILTDDLPAGEKIGFETSSLSTNLSVSDIASYEVIAYPHQFQF